MFAALLTIALFAVPLCSSATTTTTVWNCTVLAAKQLHPGARWTKQRCFSPAVPAGPPSSPKVSPAGPIVVNVVIADLSPATGLALVPITALPNTVTPLNNMSNPTPKSTCLYTSALPTEDTWVKPCSCIVCV